jgi:hypothetical protein
LHGELASAALLTEFEGLGLSKEKLGAEQTEQSKGRVRTCLRLARLLVGRRGTMALEAPTGAHSRMNTHDGRI